MTKNELLGWLENPDTLPEVRALIGRLDRMQPQDQAAWSLAWIAEQIRACDHPQADQWASWAVSEHTRRLLHRALFAWSPDAEPVRPVAFQLVRARVIQD